ncbi:hypothetical protein [Polaribacter uvawellassae]|uniref:hypothetical protein n=1 Tax=Polaribacter uvawellassae TaxID=3133495 RepID=UPI0032191C12
MKKKSFAYFFTKEDLENCMNLEKLFINTKVYTPFSFETYIEFDENLTQFLSKKETEKQKEEARKPIITNTYQLNPVLIDEIYNSFLREKTLYIDDFVENKMKNIRLLIKLAHNQERKKEIVEKHLKKSAKKIAKTDLAEHLFNQEKQINLISDSSRKTIKKGISQDFDQEIAIDFLTHGYEMNYFEHDLFKEYYEIDFNQRLIKRLEEINIKIDKESSTNQKKDNNDNYLSKIWVSQVYESMFHSLLVRENVIDIDNNALTGFKNVCANFFNIKNSLKYQIIKKRVLNSDFAEFLNKKYRANIEIKKGFKIGNKNTLTDDFNDYVDDFLNKHKNE